jgi:hypothetical protein
MEPKYTECPVTMEDLKREWERMKEIGVDKGILIKRADGALVGRGDPNDWFDAVEEEDAKGRG